VVGQGIVVVVLLLLLGKGVRLSIRVASGVCKDQAARIIIFLEEVIVNKLD